MTSYTLALDRALQGSGPRGFHLTNLLLHLLSSLLLFQVLRRLGSLPLAGLASRVCSALHPVQTEAVVWASGRTDLLATLLVLLTLAASRSARRTGRRAGTLLRFARASARRESARFCQRSPQSPFPAVLLGYEVAGLSLQETKAGRGTLEHLWRRFQNPRAALYLLLIRGLPGIAVANRRPVRRWVGSR